MAAKEGEVFGLVGDVGGTNARFALAHVGAAGVRMSAPRVLQAADFATAGAALSAYLTDLAADARPQLAVIAAAGPVRGGAVRFTNNTRWSFSEADLTGQDGLAAVRLINDFAAQALAIDHLAPAALHRVGPPGEPQRAEAAAVLGPGTGFGVAALAAGSLAAVSGEGGHVGFAPGDDVEIDILTRLARRFGRVSIERILSGPGLHNLYQALAEIEGAAVSLPGPAEVTRAALGDDPLARKTLDRFCGILGSVAGDFALAYGARRGVYVAGGIAPTILAALEAGDFRRRFEDKGRMSDYLRLIPTYVVLEPHAALIGAATLLGTLHP